MQQLTENLGRLQRIRLDNGLEVLLLPQHHAPVVSFQTWLRTGSAQEQIGKTGLAHFFEHLSYKGTSNVGAGQYDRLIEERGGDAGASTWFDWTEYHVDVPSSALELAMELESDRLQNLVLDEEIVADEKPVVLSERRDVVDDDPIGAANELLWSKALDGHPYAHPTIGWQKDIESYTVEDCRDFYAQHYHPGNVVIAIVGDFDTTRAVQLLRRKYGQIPAKEGAQRSASLTAPASGGEHQIALSVVTPKTLFAFPAPAYSEKEHVALSLASTILGTGASSRITRALAYEKELLYDFSLDTYPLQLPSLVEATLEGHDQVPIERAEGEFWRLLEAFVEQGPTEDELLRAKNRQLLVRWSSIETNAGLAEEMGLGAVLCGQPDFFLKRTRWFEECTAHEVQSAAKRFFLRDLATTVRVEAA